MNDNQENVSDEADELFSENYKVLKILMKMVNVSFDVFLYFLS